MRSHSVIDLVYRKDGPDRKGRIRRSDHEHIGFVHRIDHAGCSGRLWRTVEGERSDIARMVPFDEVRLEVDPFALVGLDPGRDDIIGGGDEFDVIDAEAFGQIRGDGRQRFTGPEPCGPMCTEGEVFVAEPERGVDTEFCHLGHHRERVICTPPAVGPDGATEGVQHRVRVGRDVNAVSLGVVTNVDDDPQQAGLDNRAKRQGHPGATDPTGEQRDLVIEVSPVRLQNAPHMSTTSTRQAIIATVVLSDPDGGLEETLIALDQQVYGQVGAVVIGAGEVPDIQVSDRRVVARPHLSDVLESLSATTTHLWIVREGAIPRPDALEALVADMERTDAGIAGSKLVGGEDDSLVSVGLVTDVFCVPYTGMDGSERDQGQYDVVRDVAALTGVSMLIRRDLLAGLGGIDQEMARLAASIDLAQRARLKGARIIVSPASEVEFDKATASTVRWHEEASRIRSMLKVYGVLTLLWTLPLEFLTGVFEAFVSMFLGKWLFFDLARSWGWNVIKFPGTFSARREARNLSVGGDADLFRFQRRGSVKVTVVGQDVAAALRRRLPGDERLSVESIGADVRQPAFVVGALALVFVLLSSRNIWSDGLPAVGFTLPFPVNGWDALAGYAGGWNPAGLGSPETLRPLIALSGVARILTLHSATLAEYILVAGSMLLGIWGITRLLRTWSISPAPGLIAGVVYVAGSTAQGIAGNTHIGTVIALGVLPWALRICLAPLHDGLWTAVARVSTAVLVFGILGGFSPLMLLVPVPALALYALVRFNDATAWRGLVIALVGTAGGALLLSPWIFTVDLFSIARDGYAYWNVSSVLAVAGAVVAAAAVLGTTGRLGIVAGWGAALAGLGFLGSRAGELGLGVEAESVSLAVAGLGLAVVVGIVSHNVLLPGIASWRRLTFSIGSVGIVLLIVATLVILVGGRAGLPGDRYIEALGFTEAHEGDAERTRVLVVGPEELMPGDSRTIQGGAYRVVSATVPDLAEARLHRPLDFDVLLEEKLRSIIAGETRRAGGELATFGIHWIIITGDSSGSDADAASLAWRNVFAGQLDLLPLSSASGNAIFVSDIEPVGRALTSSADSWARVGWSYEGQADDRRSVFVAENPDEGWGPPPRSTVGAMNEVSAAQGVVTYEANGVLQREAVASLIAVMALLAIAVLGRRLR